MVPPDLALHEELIPLASERRRANAAWIKNLPGDAPCPCNQSVDTERRADPSKPNLKVERPSGDVFSGGVNFALS
jgi:hypothetical protein